MTAATLRVLLPRRRGRAVELTMVLFAIVITVTAYIAVGLGHDNRVPAGAVSYGVALGLLFLAAHAVIRITAPYADPLLLPAAAVLNGLGLAVIHRLDLASADTARAAHHPVPTGDARLQLVWTVIGIGLFAAVLVGIRDHRILQRYMYTAMVVGLVLLLIPSVLPASHSEVNGARVWIKFGGLSFQPSELAKLALEVFFAGYLVTKRDLLSLASRRVVGVDLPRPRDLGPLLLAWLGSMVVLVRERDIGTSLLFFGIFLAMIYVATGRRSWLLIGCGLFGVGAFVCYHLFGHVRERVDIWLHPWPHAASTGYQLVQSLFGLATGGILGTGLGQGQPGIVPFVKTDFIGSAIGEELGLTGLAAVIIVYLLLTERGMRTALAVRDGFGKLLATGLAFGLALQVFVQLGGSTRLIPLTGITLPFLSYGGSSLVTNWMLVALLVRISDASRRPATQSTVAADEAMTQVVRR